MKCKNCNIEFYNCKVLESDLRSCPKCGSDACEGTLVEYDFLDTGYAISFGNFVGFLRSQGGDPDVQETICGWLGCEIEEVYPDKILLKDTKGIYIPLLAAHLKIQSNPQWQNILYNKAMTIWR